MINEPPKHLQDKYRLYAIWFESGYGARPADDMVIVHVGRPVSFATLCESYIFQHIELITETQQQFLTNKIVGIQKIGNDNKPKYELTLEGKLLDL